MAHREPNKWWVLVAGRRPLRPTWSQDENDGEYSKAVGAAFALLLERGVPRHRIRVLKTDHADEGPWSPEVDAFEHVSHSSPAALLELLASLPGPDAHVFVLVLSHGKTDKTGELWDVPERDKRGLSLAVQPHDARRNRWCWMFPVASELDNQALVMPALDAHITVELYYGAECRQVDVSGNALHWQQLARTLRRCTAATQPNIASIVFIAGACYGGGMFCWLPEHSLDKNQQPTPPFKPHLVDLDEARQVFDADHSHSFELEEARRTLASLPIAAICSSDFEYMSGTWFWYEWLRTVKLLLASGQGHTTIEQLYAILHARDPSLEYDPAYGVAARGEPSDATMLSFFCGDNDRVRSLTIEELFSF